MKACELQQMRSTISRNQSHRSADQIYGYELSGAKANQLKDQRNTLLDTLSGLLTLKLPEDISTTAYRSGKTAGTFVRHASYKQFAVAEK